MMTGLVLPPDICGGRWAGEGNPNELHWLHVGGDPLQYGQQHTAKVLPLRHDTAWFIWQAVDVLKHPA
jgi:hypothetical protein